MSDLSLISRQFVDALLRLDSDVVETLLADLLPQQDGLAPLEDVVVPALEHLGRAWEEGNVSLSQVYMAGRMCEKAVTKMLPADRVRRGEGSRLAIGVLEDHHALGKRMVASALHSSGYEALDYGHGLRPEDFVEMAVRDEIDLLLISCLMLASAVKVEEVVAGLRKAGSPALVVVGGAPFRLEPGLWRTVGAQATGRNSAEAVRIVQTLVEE